MAAMEKKDKTLNVPHLRFPEFSGEWEICKVSDILDFYSTNSLAWEQLEYGAYGLKNLHYGLIHNGLSTCLDTKDAILPVIKQNCIPKNYTECQNGDVAFADASEDTNDVAKCVEFTDCHADKVVCGLHTIHGRDKGDKTVVGFKGYAFSSQAFRHQIRRLAQGTKIYSISSKNFSECNIGIPSKEEQTKIATLLKLIEQRILTQKKIIEDLKKLKDAICNLNFTSGSSLTLGDVGYFVRGLTYSASDVIDDTAGTAVMRSNNISNGDPVNFDELIWVNKTPNHDQILRAGDMVICMANGSSALVGKSSYYINSDIELATVGAFCGIYRSDNPLAKWLFQSIHYKKHLQRSIQGGNGAIANIYPEDILAISFNIPADHERILNILNSLEEKHLLEHKLLCGYLGVKSHLLSQLFI